MQFLPSTSLAPYIKNYTVIAIDNDLDDEVFYPSGFVDLVIKFDGAAATTINGRRKDTPSVELLGHLTRPTRLSVKAGTTILIARIYPYASALFFPDPLSVFTDYATDLYDVSTIMSKELYDRMIHASTIEDRIRLLDNYFLEQLRKHEKRLKKAGILLHLCNYVSNSDSFELPALAQHAGMSERYIQQLYLANVGISPAAFAAVTRFNKSLHLLRTAKVSLTDIAYECGYYDQAHFIRIFKQFTGIVPSAARRSLVKNDESFQQAVNIGF
ncbi:MAG: helix-turn-helix transcriptional regulator [Filimonas sp.]|nr:helix-turn-helix transcriptional regulator [Filimonas sp.]